MVNIYTEGYYSAIKTKKILLWMKLESIMLNEISQTEKDKYYVISHVESKKAKLIETENGLVVVRSCGEKNWEMLVKGYNLPVIK